MNATNMSNSLDRWPRVGRWPVIASRLESRLSAKLQIYFRNEFKTAFVAVHRPVIASIFAMKDN